MPKDAKYGQVNIPGAPEDEPIIVLRAQDKFAVAALETYEYECGEAGCDETHMGLIHDTIEKFNAWPTKKVPDTKPEQLT